jgi:beta-N-acetylglucosaminidase
VLQRREMKSAVGYVNLNVNLIYLGKERIQVGSDEWTASSWTEISAAIDYKFAVKHSEGTVQFVNLNTDLIQLLEDTKA